MPTLTGAKQVKRLLIAAALLAATLTITAHASDVGETPKLPKAYLGDWCYVVYMQAFRNDHPCPAVFGRFTIKQNAFVVGTEHPKRGMICTFKRVSESDTWGFDIASTCREKQLSGPPSTFDAYYSLSFMRGGYLNIVATDKNFKALEHWSNQ